MKTDGAEIKVFVNQPGPLPLKATITPAGTVTEPIFVSGSCSSSEDGQEVGVELYVDGKLAGSSVIYADKANERKATVASFFDYDVPFIIKEGKVQPVEIELRASNANTATDDKDVFNLTIVT